MTQTPSALALDLDEAERRQLLDAAGRMLETLSRRRATAPMFSPTPDALIDEMLQAPPEQGRDVDATLTRLLAAAQCGWSKSSGGDLAYIPNGGIASGVIAALLASGMHAFTGAAFEAPALVAMEESVLRWLAGVFGLPPTSEGLLLSGGSLANLTAIVCARDAGGFDPARSVAYMSERAHHSLPKALHIAGVPDSCVRVVPTDAQQRIDVAALAQQIERDRATGLQQWLIAGTAGTTDTGSIDDLTVLAGIAADCGAWFHVDAAYGGMFALTARGAERLRGIDAADSLTVDPHKGLMIPYGVGAVLVRKPGVLASTHSHLGAYQRDVRHLPDLPHYFERGPELTRPLRGLLVWLPLQLHGVARFRAELDRMLGLAAVAAARLSQIPQIEVLMPPALSIVVFRARAGEEATDRILAAINNSGRFHVSSTTLQGHAAIRLAFLHPRTTVEHVDAVARIVRQAAA